MTTPSKRPLEIEDLYAITLVSEPAIAPDGQQVVWVETRLDKDDDTYKAALWIANIDGGNARQLTSGTSRDTAPAWSPDGATVAFLSNRPGTAPDKAGTDKPNGKPPAQVWLIAPNGGEARQLTRHPNGVSSFTWSPDGRRVAFAAQDDVTEEDGYTAPVTTGVKADELVVHHIRYKFNGVGFIKRYSHIWTVDVDTGEDRRLTDADASDSDPAWSPDGRLIAFIGNRRQDRHAHPTDTVLVVPANGGEPRAIGPEDGRFSAPVWSPDGTRLAFLGHEDALHGYGRNTRVWTVRPSGEDLTEVTAGIDISFEDAGMSDLGTGGPAMPVWDGDGAVLVTASTRGATRIWRVPLDGAEPRALTSDTARVLQFDRAPDGGTIVYVSGGIDRPFHLRAADADGANDRELRDPNAALLERAWLASPVELTATAPDGGEVQAWVLPPYGMEPSSAVRYPLILQIHGGPHSMYGHAMFHEMQVMAGRGYGIVFSNPRGSSGYGEAFTSVTRGVWGESDMPDVIAALEAACEQPWVDTDRLGVTGGSYGGYLTNWIVGHDDRFRAAVTQRCVSNFHSFVGTSDIGFDFGVHQFDGTPWSDAEKLLRYSPISYVDRIETPLLIIHSEQDIRCPIEQAEQMYTALKVLDREVSFVRIPDENHELSRAGTPSRRIARLHHLIGWFDTHL